MLREASVIKHRDSKTEAFGNLCPRCGTYLQGDRWYGELVLSCPNCGFSSREDIGYRMEYPEF